MGFTVFVGSGNRSECIILWVTNLGWAQTQIPP